MLPSREAERKEWREEEEEINKLNKVVETMSEVNRNLAQGGKRLLHTSQVMCARTHTRSRHKDRHLSACIVP